MDLLLRLSTSFNFEGMKKVKGQTWGILLLIFQCVKKKKVFLWPYRAQAASNQINQNKILVPVFCWKPLDSQFQLNFLFGTRDVFGHVVNPSKMETVLFLPKAPSRCTLLLLSPFIMHPTFVPLSTVTVLPPAPLYCSQLLINLYSAVLSLNPLFFRPLSSLSPQCAASPGGSHLMWCFITTLSCLHSRCLPACLHKLTTRAAQAEDSFYTWLSVCVYPLCLSATWRQLHVSTNPMLKTSDSTGTYKQTQNKLCFHEAKKIN